MFIVSGGDKINSHRHQVICAAVDFKDVLQTNGPIMLVLCLRCLHQMLW